MEKTTSYMRMWLEGRRILFTSFKMRTAPTFVMIEFVIPDGKVASVPPIACHA
jgi:hypothetical protein